MAKQPESDLDPVPWVGLAGGALPLAALAYVLPSVTALAHDGTVGLPPATTVVGTMRIAAWNRWSEPASAYPADVSRHMPGPTWWWLTIACVLICGALLAVIVWRRVEPAAASARLGRRPYDPRGSRSRTWARPRDLRELTSRDGRTNRFSVGHIDGRRLHADADAHIAVVAPTRSGKTTRCVIPWLLEHEGPAIVTSTKTDVLEVTAQWRARHGRVQVFDPFGPHSSGWTPIPGCEDWTHALSQAQWLADATPDGDSEIAAYWRGEAAKLLAPLLHAAALDQRGIDEVLRWVDAQDRDGPRGVLHHHGSADAEHQLLAVLSLDPRNRGTTYMSAGSLLAAYRYPEVRGVARPDIRVDDFLDGGAHTVYLVASARQQRLLAPLVAGLLNAMLHGAMERPHRGSTVRVLLDEVANIAPLRDLPTYLSQAAGHEIRIATIWQSLAQLERRYGRDSDTLLANSTAKLFMGPVTDDATRRYLTHLLGDADVPTTTTTAPSTGTGGQSRTTGTTQRPAASPRDLQQLGRDRAILVNGAHVPAVVALKPWWDVATIRRRARTDDVSSKNPSFMYESSDLPIGLPLRGTGTSRSRDAGKPNPAASPHHGGDAQRELPFD